MINACTVRVFILSTMRETIIMRLYLRDKVTAVRSYTFRFEEFGWNLFGVAWVFSILAPCLGSLNSMNPIALPL